MANTHAKVRNLISQEKSKLTTMCYYYKTPRMVKITMLARMWRKGNAHMLLVGVYWYKYFGKQFGIIY